MISFDDGYRGDYSDAMPILGEHGWSGDLNLELGALADGELTDQMIKGCSEPAGSSTPKRIPNQTAGLHGH